MVSEELQKKYITFQLAKQQLEAMLEQKNTLEKRMSELAATMEALEGLEKAKKGEDIWSTLGSGAFVQSSLKDADKVLVSVGAGVAIRKGREEAIAILRARIDELRELGEELVRLLTRHAEQTSLLETEVQKLAEKESD